ncbi:hypothetical protein [Lentibacillus salinarum]|uniref:Permease n=1 Tax=Lentibacillus salinarum TaxID=446820 RepID=A0ABW3ZWZ1_9BACI
MILFGLLVLGCIGWLVVFTGWWIPSPNIALTIGMGLFIFLLIELTFLRKRNTVTFSAVLTYANMAFGCWVHQFWQSHGYPYPLWTTRFMLIVALMLSAVMLVGFIKGRSSGDKNRSRHNDNKSFKGFVEQLLKRKKDTETKREVSIVLGESAEEHHENDASGQ